MSGHNYAPHTLELTDNDSLDLSIESEPMSPKNKPNNDSRHVKDGYDWRAQVTVQRY